MNISKHCKMLCKRYHPCTNTLFMWIKMKILIFWSSYLTNYQKSKIGFLTRWRPHMVLYTWSNFLLLYLIWQLVFLVHTLGAKIRLKIFLSYIFHLIKLRSLVQTLLYISSTTVIFFGSLAHELYGTSQFNNNIIGGMICE